MGWSESYYDDMRREAEAELRVRAPELLAALADLRLYLARHRDFVPGADELEAAAAELEGLLGDYGRTA